MYSNLPFLENSLIENQEYFLSLHYKSEFLLLLSSIATTNDSLSLFFQTFINIMMNVFGESET
ncbi:hypothetical protein C095_02585 [Fusobacterium necrophorum subsp. funduliforme B35]|uniref:Uncharacterized protein n=1 Tax=Fusobacterium necrophorum subsp. funduliforme B35 TaxID=1226633 RepID=A0A0B4E840_9FUSO|nr:hypothetical protein C095_02585 [Fusobacterium necrophorum subsp. funduliforme B35]